MTRPNPARARIRSLLLAFCLVVLGSGMPVASALSGDLTTGSVATGKVILRIDPTASTLTTGTAGAEIVGSISNDSGAAVSDATIHIGVSGIVLDTAAALDNWQQGRTRISPPTVAKASTGAIADGAVRPFRVKIPADKLPWKYQLAALPMTITLTDGAAVTASSTLQLTRTTLQMQQGTPASPLQVGWVVPLTLPADPALFGPSGAARDQAWNRAIGSGSRVRQLLASLAGQPITWLIDPILLDPPVGADGNVPVGRIPDPASSTDPAPTPSSPPSSTPPSTPAPGSTSPSPASSPQSSAPSATPPASTAGSSTPEPSSPTPTSSPAGTTGGDTTGSDTIPTDAVGVLVSELLTELRSLSSNQQVWWTGYDDPDTSALLNRSPALLQRDLARALPPALSAISTTRAAWPSGEVGGDEVTRIAGAWRAAGQTSAPVLVLPTRAVAAGTPTTSLRRVTGTGGAVLYNESLSRIVGSPDDPGLAASRFLAESIAIFQQLPGTERSISIAVPREATASPQQLAATIRTVRAAGWLTDLNHDAAAAKAPVATLLPAPTKGTPYPDPPPAALTPGMVESLARQRERVNTLGSILVDGADVVSARHRALDVIGSTRWRGHLDALRQVNTTNRNALAALVGKVSVNPSTVNFFADSGRLAVTVINDLNRPVHDVELHLQPRRFLLRIDGQPAPLNLRANSRISVRTEVTAISSGEVAVDARLFAPDQVPLGEPGVGTQLMVNVRPTSTWIYWVLGIVGGLVLVVGLWRSLHQGPRRATLDPTSGAPTPPDAIVATAPPRTASRQLDPEDPEDAETHRADTDRTDAAADTPTTKA